MLKLKDSGYGCHIGNECYGALSYADDIIIMCPILSDMHHMLIVCEQYGLSYNVKFNPDKTTFMFINNCNTSVIPVVKFINTAVPEVLTDKTPRLPYWKY